LQGCSSFNEPGRSSIGICTIQLRPPFPLGMWKAQDPAQDLLYRPRRTHFRHRTKHVGKRTVPAFLECLNGDNEAQRAGPVKQVDILNAANLSCGYGNLFSRYFEIVD